VLLAVAVASAVTVEAPSAGAAETSRATFAGGCYWCMEEPFDKLPGVVSVTAGWAGGRKPNPTFQVISSGKSGYAEAVDIVYDPDQITYQRLLEIYWHNVDPLTPDGQFCDRGKQYRSAIFVYDDGQRRLAEESRQRVEEELHAKVVTEIAPASRFERAPDSQQHFYKKNPARYQEYVEGCGRHRRLEQLWAASGGHGPGKQ